MLKQMLSDVSNGHRYLKRRFRCKKIKLITTENIKGSKIMGDFFYYNTIKIPKGFVTKGANFPPLFEKIFKINNFDKEFLEAFVLHDFLYYSGYKKDVADKIFLDFCNGQKLNSNKSFLLYVLYSLMTNKIYIARKKKTN